MAEEKLPRLTEAHVRELASEKSFERGETYCCDGAILEPVRQEMELRARCEGSDYEPYQVGATLAEGGIAETSCTCPYDDGRELPEEGIISHFMTDISYFMPEPTLLF